MIIASSAPEPVKHLHIITVVRLEIPLFPEGYYCNQLILIYNRYTQLGHEIVKRTALPLFPLK